MPSSNSCLPLYRTALQIRKGTRHLSFVTSFQSILKPSSSLVSLSLVLSLLCTTLYISTSAPKQPPFDDIADMQAIAQQDHALATGNTTADSNASLFATLNLTDVHQSRLTWDYVYGEILRKPVQPVLTKYKTRLLRELFAKTHYTLVSKYEPALDVSCNSVNQIPEQLSFMSFKCSQTSHKCLDGSFSRQSAFAPKEGTSITWDHVVILMMVSTHRQSFLHAAAETWISHLHPDATLLLARDAPGPPIPDFIIERPNTFVFDYQGPFGLDSLDIKAFKLLTKAYELFSLKGKRYFLKMDDDSFLLAYNLIRFLNKLENRFSSREQALYFGHPFCGHGDIAALGNGTWCYAGGGAYGLSVEALQILITQIRGGCEYFYDYVAKAPNLRPSEDRYGGRYEDIMVGRCLRQAWTRTQQRGTSLLACGSFFPYAPLHYYNKFGNNKTAMCVKLQGDVIAIHSLEPSAIRYLQHMVFEYPLSEHLSSFSAQNHKVQELIDICVMRNKRMWCDLSRVPSLCPQNANLSVTRRQFC